jgi:hypothetical protein
MMLSAPKKEKPEKEAVHIRDFHCVIVPVFFFFGTDA